MENLNWQQNTILPATYAETDEGVYWVQHMPSDMTPGHPYTVELWFQSNEPTRSRKHLGWFTNTTEAMYAAENPCIDCGGRNIQEQTCVDCLNSALGWQPGDVCWNQTEPLMQGVVIPTPKDHTEPDGEVWVRWENGILCMEDPQDISRNPK